MAATRFRPRSDPSSSRGEVSASSSEIGEDPTDTSVMPWRRSGRRFGVMGVVNATPDSFHAPSRARGIDAVRDHAERMVAEGVDLFDVGGESTRPGADPVSSEEEIARVVPVVEHLRSTHPDVPVSIDTYKASVAVEAFEAGATIVNDVTGGLLDREMASVAARLGATVIVGHIRGTPKTMREAPDYGDVVGEVASELEARLSSFRAAGVPAARLWVDPGIGFGKRASASRALLFGLEGLQRLGCPIVIGVSRKSFLGAALHGAGLEDSSPEDRLEASLAGAVLAAERGAVLVRTHDVGPTRRALALLERGGA